MPESGCTNGVRDPIHKTTPSTLTDPNCSSLGPTACYTAEIKFLPLASGVLHLEALRLVDLATQQTMDVRHLPDIVAIDRNA
jgi:hypothetical protein